ncbi:MAG: SIS domain-containing protein [Chloroflexota bacterium]|nr:SIS domain-containing protein [Chloroflexota bacterium]
MQKKYLDIVIEGIENLRDKQSYAIREAAKLVGDALADGKHVFTFGSGHSQLLAREITERAGGLAPVFHLPDPIWGMVERIEGYGETLLEQYPIQPGEVIFVISNSGRNPEPIEIAKGAKEKGLKVIAVTSLKHSKNVESRHSSGKKLFEFGDVVLDTGTPKGDAVMDFEGLSSKAGAVSTVFGAAMLNAVMVDAIQYLLDRGIEPPVLISANVDGSDEHNAELMERYKEMAWAPRYFF